MNYLVSTDWHITNKTPRIRTDDYQDTIFHKIEWICKLANKQDCPLVIAGDLYDKPLLPMTLQNQLIKIFQSVKNGVYGVWGQHDVFFHNPDLNKTCYGNLLNSKALKPVSDLGWIGVNFGEDIPEDIGILCIHHPITPGPPPFYMSNAVSAEDFMKKHKTFRVIISGDYHVHHITRTKNQLLINSGPIMRMSKDKMEYIPKVVMFDDETLEYTTFDIPIEKEVFNLDIADKDDMSEYKEELRELANSIRMNSVDKKFEDVLEHVISELKPKNRVRAKISKIMEMASTK